MLNLQTSLNLMISKTWIIIDMIDPFNEVASEVIIGSSR